MALSDLLPSNLSSLSEQLRQRTDQLCSEIIRANYKTQFTRSAPELTVFRNAMTGPIDQIDDDALCELFRKTVPLTVYDAYAPLIARLFENPCRASAVVDLFAPGLPDFLTRSSSTSGGVQKHFLRYNVVTRIRASDAQPSVVSDPLRKRTAADVFRFAVDRMDVVAEDDSPVATVYRTSGAVIYRRICSGLDPEKDEEKMGTFLLDHAAPYATGFIPKWRSFLLIYMLFAVTSRSLETMSMVFICTFVDMIRFFDVEFEMMVDCVANGTIPDLEGLAKVRRYLEMNMVPDPGRAEELRSLGRPSSHPGWCARVWPKLRSVTAMASGAFASSVPLARQFLGPDIQICPLGYGSTEAWIGRPYDPLEPNQYKLVDKELVEFLDISKRDSITSLVQPWEVEPGKRYEVVITTHNGLWRYRQEDVVEIFGFDPTDGVPVFQFVERRNVSIRLVPCTICEEDLRKAMSSLPQGMLTKLVHWTAAIDDRHVPATVGFFVELTDDQVPASDLAWAPERALEALMRSNQTIVMALELGMTAKPTIRLLLPGTFSEFEQWRIDECRDPHVQVKVPVVLTKPKYVTWFSDRVAQEL